MLTATVMCPNLIRQNLSELQIVILGKLALNEFTLGEMSSKNKYIILYLNLILDAINSRKNQSGMSSPMSWIINTKIA